MLPSGKGNNIENGVAVSSVQLGYPRNPAPVAVQPPAAAKKAPSRPAKLGSGRINFDDVWKMLLTIFVSLTFGVSAALLAFYRPYVQMNGWRIEDWHILAVLAALSVWFGYLLGFLNARTGFGNDKPTSGG